VRFGLAEGAAEEITAVYRDLSRPAFERSQRVRPGAEGQRERSARRRYGHGDCFLHEEVARGRR
jgi:hypothetical protein